MSDDKRALVNIARCPDHGLHGERDECFVCGGPVEQVSMVELVEVAPIIRALLGWSDTYEDYMGGDDFKQRDADMERARRFLLDRGETL